MQGERPHYEHLMFIAEGNHDAAIFFCGMLSVTSSEEFLCRLLMAYETLTRTADQFVDERNHGLQQPPEDRPAD